MSSVEIGELIDHSRITCRLSLIPLILYSPLGVVLTLIRFFIGLHTFLIGKLLPKTLPIRSWVLRLMCVVLGIFVKTENSDRRSKAAKILVSNHLSPLDHLAINLVLPNVTPCVWDIPDGLAWAMGFQDMGVKQGREVLMRNVTKHCQESPLPVLSHPEGASTNGKVGLLKFSTWPFSLDLPVQPLALQISRLPIFQIAVSPVGSTWWADLFWVLFLPYTLVTVRYLPVLVKEKDESEEAFSKRAQEMIAGELSLKSTPYSDTDKVEYAKRVLFEHSRAAGTPKTQPNTSERNPSSSASVPDNPIVLADLETRRLAKQVKDVLPHVPTSVILTDVVKTKNVDMTITNIVEGRVEFTPVDLDQSTSTSPDTSAPALTKFAADQFGKSSNERQMSFEDRKKAMIANARKRFLEKHALL